MTEGMTLEQYERIDPVATFRRGAAEMRFATPNRMTFWRVESVLEKEPETIRWIEGFEAGEIMVDAGANVGMYAVWAAATRGARVFAFEPESQNYATLCRNVALNGLAESVTAFCTALSDECGFGTLHLSALEAGRSCHSFGEALDFNLEPQRFPFHQGSFSATLDSLVAQDALPAPNHIKIDVDGIEHKVIAGAAACLADPACRSVLVEINRKVALHRAIVETLERLGFSYDAAEAESALRKDGLFEGVGNHVFRR
ncbi:MAG: FkbM family methyltransferase [Rhodospirillaceae bacterium]|jgi:FkbM family methyltransferase|nr:FkbM family methyltransferase [Rhodospirillaceae bacterium]MBT6117970.1 FkbM family methyltransferase [Rhodospirillaceae bacterium]